MTAQKGFAFAAAIVIVLGSALISHFWQDEGGLDPVYTILALLVLAIAFPSTRQWLREATKVKLPGGFEISREVEDAVAEAALLPDADESIESASAKRRLKILKKDWSGNPKSGLGLLQAALKSKLDWIEKEFYGKRRDSDSKTLDKLREDGLIGPGQARLLRALSEATGTAIDREFAKGGSAKEGAVKFMEESDRTLARIRLIVLDQKVRQELQEHGLRVMDIGGQPPKQWPDFYAFNEDARQFPPLRVAPRVALNKKSKVLEPVMERLRDIDELRLDPTARKVVVIPRRSKSEWTPDPKVDVLRRSDLPNWIDERPEPEEPPAG